MKTAESGPARDLQPVIFQGVCAPAPQDPRASNAPVLNATGASKGWDQWDTMPCPRARQHLSLAAGRLQVSDLKSQTIPLHPYARPSREA